MKVGISILCSLFITLNVFSQEVNIIPQPVSAKMMKGTFAINKETVIVLQDAGNQKSADFLNDYIKSVYGFKLTIGKQQKKNSITLITKVFIRKPDKDGYNLNIDKNGINISGDTYTGTFYGVQSLIQLLPVGNFKPGGNLQVPYITIRDFPRFDYRGIHLDCCRHFFPIDFVKKYIDFIALHKMNYFHWHLTDDQGWRIEIKKYPRLTQVGGWRNGTIIGRYPGTGNDNQRYGGYYTQEQVKEIVKYAADRFITVIPEIEMPGHSSAAIAAYPFLSCFPEQETIIPSHPSTTSAMTHGKKVQETWGVFDDVFCAGNDSTFDFLQNVLDEVMALFPAKYIHVGGDECPKTNWKKCPKCQARMKALGLKNEMELQSYFVQRMEKYINGKGRTIIGWDEILEGGLAPNAVVMSWRGEKGGVDAANDGHKVIMTPGEYVYLDHSQSKNEDSLTIGGYTPVEKVYAYEPVPKGLDSTKANFVEGAQGNVWTEYIAYPSKVEYMIFPRMSALSEAVWSPKENRNWNDFEKRLQTQFKRYDLWKVNYSKAYYDIRTTILPADDSKGVLWKLETNLKNGRIGFIHNYSSDVEGQDYFDYDKPIKVLNSTNYKVALFNNGKEFSSITQSFFFNKATGKKVSIVTPPTEKYPGQGGAFSLVNGVYSNKGLSYPDWLGWIGDDMDATINLGKQTSFNSVKMHTIDQNGSWVYLPKYVEVFTSHDGINFTSVGKSSEFVKDTLTMGWITVNFPAKNARYVKVVAKNYGLIPDGLPGAGNKAWLFADEIQIY